MGERELLVGGGPEATMHTGPLGSTIHVLRADAGTIVELAAIDWNRWFRRVCLDPVGGLITLMAPSRLHDELATVLGDVVDIAASTLSGAVKGLRTARLREPGAPPGTGLEPDCAFYLGERARAYRVALLKGREAADAFFEKTAPDLVVEVEITNADREKIERYGSMGVRELWLLRHRDSEDAPAVDFLALRPRTTPRPLTASNVLGGLTPADVRDAVTGLRRSVTRDERTEAVARIVRRRQRTSVRVHDESAQYSGRLEDEQHVEGGEAGGRTGANHGRPGVSPALREKDS